jgi:hypothetical protein
MAIICASVRSRSYRSNRTDKVFRPSGFRFQLFNVDVNKKTNNRINK